MQEEPSQPFEPAPPFVVIMADRPQSVFRACFLSISLDSTSPYRNIESVEAAVLQSGDPGIWSYCVLPQRWQKREWQGWPVSLMFKVLLVQYSEDVLGGRKWWACVDWAICDGHRLVEVQVVKSRAVAIQGWDASSQNVFYGASVDMENFRRHL